MLHSQMPVMAAPTMDSNRLLHNSDIVSTLAPTLRVALQCQQLLSTASLFVVLRASLITSHILYASQSFAVWSVVTSRFILLSIVALSGKAWLAVWNSPTTKRIRKKVVFEFFTLILGCGNNFCLLVFWPGWWVLGFIGLMIWICAGR